MKFAPLSWVLTLLWTCRSCIVAFLWLSMIIVSLMLLLPLILKTWEQAHIMGHLYSNFCFNSLLFQIIITPNSLLTFYTPLICSHLKVQICNAGIEETALAAYGMMDGIDRSGVGVFSWPLSSMGTSLMVHWPN